MSRDKIAVCNVCPHRCTISEGALGLCGARGNENGEVVSLNYGRAVALSLDPIEKKPLSRFMPGSLILSYGSFGCNLKCKFCQNSDISMLDANCDSPILDSSRFITAEGLVLEARRLIHSGNIGIALTYNEPMISPEYLIDVGEALDGSGLKLVIVTNGYSSEEYWKEACKVVDAFNIDLKSFSDSGYAKVGAPDGFEIVKRNIEQAVESGAHVELTTLVVPGISDDREDFRHECEWIASMDPSIPFHISRYFPHYKMTTEGPTDLGLLNDLKHIAEEYLDNVFLGNV